MSPFKLLTLALALTLAACAAPPAEEPVAPPAEEAQTTAPEPPNTVPWQRPPAPEIPTDRPLQVGFLILEGVYNTELTAPFDIFHHTRFHHPPGMEVFTISPDGEKVTTFEGLRIEADYGFDNTPAMDILVVPSAENNMDSDLEDEVLIDWVRRHGEQALFVVSLCDGAFVLAQAGLLDGLASTTFPSDQDAFAERFPHLDLRRGVSFVHDGKAITSEGGARSFDASIYLVDLLYGQEVAHRVARGLVIPWPPTAEAMPALVVAP